MTTPAHELPNKWQDISTVPLDRIVLLTDEEAVTMVKIRMLGNTRCTSLVGIDGYSIEPLVCLNNATKWKPVTLPTKSTD